MNCFYCNSTDMKEGFSEYYCGNCNSKNRGGNCWVALKTNKYLLIIKRNKCDIWIESKLIATIPYSKKLEYGQKISDYDIEKMLLLA